VKCAQLLGAEVRQHSMVTGLSQRPDGTWDVHVENGDPIHAEHVVNAGGLWAREVGRMVGIELPVLAMEHMYLLTVDMPEVAANVAKTGKEMPMALDFAGEIYIRQEGGGMLLGTYEQAAVPWSPRETPWDFGSQLLKPDLDRITPELNVAFKHYPAMGTTGIRKVVNGPFTFSPDGNPLVGPVRGLRGYWVACGVMAGLSQGGGVGLALSAWMTAGDAGDSGMDIWAMDVARYGDYANLAYTNAKVQENYRRRFRITFPNEELPAGRPHLTTPIHDRLTAANAVWGATAGLEHALWFQKEGLEPKEDVTFRRSNAWECVAEEVAAVRERVGMTEISNYAKYRVTGPAAQAWLSSLLTARMPAPGRITLTAMLNDAGRIVGEFTVARASDADEFHLFGSLPAETHHSRWFLHHLPADGSVEFEVLGLGLVGLSLTGPKSRDVLSAVAPDLDLSTAAFPFMTFRRVDLGMQPALVARINYSGDLGYELWVKPEHQRALFDRIVAAGQPHGLRLFGMRALMSLRLEKSYGTWFREYRPIYTPAEGGITRYLRLDHEFVGRAAHEAELASGGPKRRLVTFVVDPEPDDPADVIGDEPVWHDGKVVGWITSGGFGHHVKESIALGYVPTELASPDGPGGDGFEIEIIGRRRPARLQPEPLFDPQGLRMRQ
jgi:dimethylglycine dehydrogenase